MYTTFQNICKLSFSIFLLCTLSFNAGAQSELRDSMTFGEFREMVIANHPVLKQAHLNLMKGENAVKMAKGNFDPKIEASYANKFFKQQEYYNLNSVSVKVPTPSPVQLKFGFDKNTGNYFNPENNTTQDGLLVAGISLPIIQGFITDERRTAVNQSEAFNRYSEWQKKITTNDLLLAAYNQYCAWWAAFAKKEVAQGILTLAEERMVSVRERASAGDLPMIDTLETFTQMQMRMQVFMESQASEIKERMLLSSFLWDKNEDESVAIIIPESIAPSANNIFIRSRKEQMNMEDIVNTLKEKNPLLRQYEWKFESLYAEEKLKKEKLKPSLNVNYNLLSQNASGDAVTQFSTNNYKWGIDFSFPIFVRQGRGDLQLTKIKIQETNFEQQQKGQDLFNKALSLQENISLLRKQLILCSSNQNNYYLLLQGEKEKFQGGESSVFLVNLREQQFAESRNKLIDIQFKIMCLQNELDCALGIIE